MSRRRKRKILEKKLFNKNPLKNRISHFSLFTKSQSQECLKMRLAKVKIFFRKSMFDHNDPQILNLTVVEFIVKNVFKFFY